MTTLPGWLKATPFAHRGLHAETIWGDPGGPGNRGAPENSLEAVAAAIAAGIEAIEVDVRATLDGVAFVLHDPTLDRTTAAPPHAAYRGGGIPLDALDAGQARAHRLFNGERLPRLADVVDLCRGRAHLYLDVKDDLAAKHAIEAAAHDLDGIGVWSPIPGVIERAAARGVEAALIAWGTMGQGVGRFLWEAQEIGARAVSFYPADVEPHVAAACHNHGLPFRSGTPNDTRTWHQLADYGIAGIVTDYPLACRAFLRPPSPPSGADLPSGHLKPHRIPDSPRGQ